MNTFRQEIIMNKYQAVGFGKAENIAVTLAKQVGVWLSSNNQMQCMAGPVLLNVSPNQNIGS